VSFRESTYIASGPPARMRLSGPQGAMIVRNGNAGQVPIYTRSKESQVQVPDLLWAPITDQCIFLSFVVDTYEYVQQ
jgi:hypothetical protein